MIIKIKRLHPDAKLPSYAHPGDVGLDLFSLEDYDLKPGEMRHFYVGFALEFENGYAGIIKDKGGMAKSGLHTMGGVFDAGYRGEYNVQLVNLGKETYHVAKGNKIAQLVILPAIIAEVQEVQELNQSSRGEGKFGSTGK